SKIGGVRARRNSVSDPTFRRNRCIVGVGNLPGCRNSDPLMPQIDSCIWRRRTWSILTSKPLKADPLDLSTKFVERNLGSEPAVKVAQHLEVLFLASFPIIAERIKMVCETIVN